MLKELTQYIENNTVYVIGTNLFAGKIPPKKEGIVAVVEQRDPGVREGHFELKDIGQTPFRIVARGASKRGYFETLTVAQTIFDLLNGANQITLPVINSGSTYLVNITCNTPYYVGQDEKERDMIHVYITVSQEEI